MSEKIDKKPDKKPQLGDKIFGAHNNPTQDNDFRESFEIDMSHHIIENAYDEEAYLHLKKLEESVFKAFQASRWYHLSYEKKIPRDLIPHLFQDVLEKLEGDEFGFSEKFAIICDFIRIPYHKAYELVPIRYKENIINELEEKYGALSRMGIKKLF